MKYAFYFGLIGLVLSNLIIPEFTSEIEPINLAVFFSILVAISTIILFIRSINFGYLDHTKFFFAPLNRSELFFLVDLNFFRKQYDCSLDECVFSHIVKYHLT